jgi:hypothetical protein
MDGPQSENIELSGQNDPWMGPSRKSQIVGKPRLKGPMDGPQSENVELSEKLELSGRNDPWMGPSRKNRMIGLIIHCSIV